jgi:trigger factor
VEIRINKANNNADALLTIHIKLEDIEEEVSKQLHQTKHKLNLPGFRPGKIPTDIAKKYLWEGLIKQELEKKLEASIEDYFKTHNIEILRPVLPIPEDNPIELKNFNEADFNYNIGIIEDFAFEPKTYLEDIHHYSVKVAKKDIDEEIEYIRHNYGKHTHPEEIEDSEHINLSLKFTELNQVHEPLEAGVIQTLRKDLKDLPATLKETLIGKKQNDEIIFDITGAFKTKKDLADFLNIEKLVADDLNSEFSITIMSIHMEEPAELNEELFDKYSQGKAKSENEFRNHIEGLLISSYERQAEDVLTNHIFKTLLDKVEINLPVKYLELLFNIEIKERMKDLNSEQIKQEKTEFDKKIKWSLISDHLTKKYALEATENEIVQEAYIYLYSYFYQYGIQNAPEDQMAKYVTEYLKNDENLYRTRSQVLLKKLFDEIKKSHEFGKKEITSDKFKKLKLEK